MFEANYSRQMGQHKKKIFHQMFLCLRSPEDDPEANASPSWSLCLVVPADSSPVDKPWSAVTDCV